MSMQILMELIMKRFFGLGASAWFEYIAYPLFSLGTPILLFYFICTAELNSKEIFVSLISGIVFFILWILLEIQIFRESILFSNDHISIKGDLAILFPGGVNQHAVTVKYADIVDLDCELRITNSKGKTRVGKLRSTPYLILCLKNRKKEAIDITIFSISQRKKIFNELIRRVENAGVELPVISIESLIEKSRG